MRPIILRDPDPSDGGSPDAPPSWIETLPPELHNEPSLKTVPDVNTLAKNYVEAQKFIGTKRLEAPSENWDDNKWGEFYNGLGRPETHEKYAVPQMPEGVELEETRVATAKEHMHKLGLTKKQFEGVMEFYGGMVGNDLKTVADQKAATVQEAEDKLKTEWGDKYESNAELARAAMKKYATPETVKFLEESGLGNNAELVKVFAKIGSQLIEDSIGSGRGPGLTVSDEVAAQAEIEQAKGDPEFVKAAFTAHHPNHKQAKQRWQDLHKRAYPGVTNYA